MKIVEPPPVTMSADPPRQGGHFLVPVCGTCQREIDRDLRNGQWYHVGAALDGPAAAGGEQA